MRANTGIFEADGHIFEAQSEIAELLPSPWRGQMGGSLLSGGGDGWNRRALSVRADALRSSFVQPDEAAHAPVRAALKAIAGTEYEIHWVTSPRAAIAALDEHPHDAFLVDRDLHDGGHSGLAVARA